MSNFLANLVKFLRRKFTIFSYFKIISTFNFQIRFFPQFVRNAGETVSFSTSKQQLTIQPMADLIVRNIDEAIVKALKKRASQHGISAEAEHRQILEKALLQPQRKSLAEVLRQIPNVGNDSDFDRVQDDTAKPVFD